MGYSPWGYKKSDSTEQLTICAEDIEEKLTKVWKCCFICSNGLKGGKGKEGEIGMN